MKNGARRIIIHALTALFCLSGCINETYDVLEKEEIAFGYKDVQANEFYPSTLCPAKGKITALVIPVWYEDSDFYIAPSYKESVREDIRKAFFGTDEETGWKSVTSYYAEASYGALEITGVVADWYEIGKKTTDVASTQEMYELAENVGEAYISSHPEEDYSKYDIDNNGAFDAYCIVNAGPLDYEKLIFWGYVDWERKDPEVNDRLDIATKMIVSHGFMYNEDNYSEKTGVQREAYYGHKGGNIDAHAFVHEFGHLLGADDYYDYNAKNPNYYSGGFSMQDLCCGTHDPYSDMCYGWVKPYIPTESCTIKLNSYAKTGDFVILKDEWNKYKSPFDEYLILEYYTPDGLNQRDAESRYRGINMNKSGLRIWHVDGRLITYTTEEIEPDMYMCHYSNELVASPNNEGSYSQIALRMQNVRAIDIHFKGFEQFRELQWVRNDSEATSFYEAMAGADDLFFDGDVFDIKKFGKQFPNNGMFDSGESFSWTVEVKSQTKDDVVLELTKA